MSVAILGGLNSYRTDVASNVLVTLGLQVLTVLVALALDALGLSQATVVIVFVLGVLLAAVFTSAPRYCLASAALSILSFNYFLVEPRRSFRIQGADVPGTMAVMFVVALLASYLVMQTRASAQASAEARSLAQEEQLRANLLRSVSHDLRTPLTSIMGNADMIMDEDVRLDEGQMRRLAASIHDDASWLSGVVENLLAVTRLEDGGLELALEVESLDDVVEEALRHVSREARHHDLRFVPSEELLLVSVDAHMMVQVVVNLVNNAVTHTQHGSHIVVATGRSGECAELRVQDDGPGVPDGEKPHVFEPFYTSRRTVADGRRGIGLGLSLCRDILVAHGGSLHVGDVEPHGASFVCRLPMERSMLDG